MTDSRADTITVPIYVYQNGSYNKLDIHLALQEYY